MARNEAISQADVFVFEAQISPPFRAGVKLSYSEITSLCGLCLLSSLRLFAKNLCALCVTAIKLISSFHPAHFQPSQPHADQ